MPVILKAREATVKFSSTDLTIDTTGPLHSDWSGSASTDVKNITISAPEGAVELIQLLGETSGFQNTQLEQKSFGLATCSGTLVLDGDETSVFSMMGGTTGTVVTGGYTRYQFGDSTAVKTRVLVGGAMITVTDGTNRVTFAFDNALVTKFSDVKLTGADGHWEVDFEMVSKPSDFYWEFLD